MNCCIFGISRDYTSDKIAELRGSLKILIQMKSPIDMIKQSIEKLMKFEDEDYIFLFFDSEKKEVSIIKSTVLCFGLCDKSVHITEDSLMTTMLNYWGVFSFRQDSEIDLTQISKHYDKSGYINDVVGNFYEYFTEEQSKENIILIQSNSNN